MIIKLKVKPGKQEEKIEFNGNEYTIYLKERAKKGKANMALIKLLAKHFNTSSANVKILRGLTSKHKIIEIKK